MRLLSLLCLCALLTGCPYTREEIGQALIGAADRMDQRETVYCTTTYGRYNTYTHCY